VSEDKVKGPANSPKCIFDVYGLKFGMSKEKVGAMFGFNDQHEVAEEAVKAIGADKAELYFDHRGWLWQVKVWYTITGQEVAEELVDRMSKDYRFQTASSRVAFELDKNEDGNYTLYIRYSDAFMKREYIHHKLAEAEVLRAKEEKEKAEKSVEEIEEEEYIPTGPMMF
jgi:hypothetical protein